MAALRAIPELRDTRIILCADRNASAADTTLLYEYVRRAGLPNVHMYVGTSGGEPGVWIDAKTRTNCWKEACRVFGDGIVYTQLEWVAGDPEAKRNQLYHQLSNLLVVRLDKLPSDCERKAAAMWVDCEQQLPYCIIRQDGMCRALTMCIFLIDGVDGGDQTLV